jgi:hypothetical protein
MPISRAQSEALSPPGFIRATVAAGSTAAPLSLFLLLCFTSPAAAPAQEHRARRTEDGSRTLSPATTPSADSRDLTLPTSKLASLTPPLPEDSASIHHADPNQDFLLQAAFYEKEGKLEITDTTLRFDNGVFSMDKARYQALLAAQLAGQSPAGQAPIEYRYENHRVAFTPAGLGWSTETGEKIAIQKGVRQATGRLIANAQELEGSDDPQLAGRGLIYENAYGEGLHLGVLTKNMVFRKIVRFDGLDRLGAMPRGAEVLEVGFELETDEATTFKATFGGEQPRLWDERETVLARGEPVEFGNADGRSFIRPAYAWDSAGDRIPLALEFRSKGGRLFLTKLVPVAWLRQAVFPVFADVDLTFGIEAVYDAANVNRMSVTTLDSTRVVIAYEDVGNGSFGTAIVGTISGKTITFGPEWVLNSASTQIRRLSATTLDSTHVVVAYRDMANSLFGTAIVGTVSGTTITFGPEWVFNPGDTFNVAATALDSTHVAMAYEDAANGSFGTAIVGTVSGGDTLTFGAEYVFEAGSTQFTSVATLDAIHFVVAYRDVGNSGFGTAIVGTVSSGDVITWGPPAVFNPADTGAVTPTRLDGTRVLIAYGDNGNLGYGTAIVGTVSGGDNLSFGSEAVYNPSTNNGWNVATTLDSNHVVIALAGSSSCCNGVTVVGTISGGNNICFGPLVDYDTGSISFPSARALDATRVVIAYRDDGSTFGTAIVGETSRLQRLIGFETANAIDEMVSLSLDSAFGTVGVRPGSGDYFLEQAVGPSTLAAGLATCEGQISVRFSFRKPINPSVDQILLQFRNGATNLWSLQLRTDGRLQVQQDEALGLTTTAGTTALADNTWYTVRAVYDRAAGGLLRVWLNVGLEVNVTHAATGTTVDEIQVSGLAAPNRYHYDDFSIADSTTPAKNGQILRREVVAAGNLTQFSTPSPPGANYLNVDEASANDSDFNQHEPSTVATDLYALADSPAGTINAVKGMWKMSRGNGASAGGTHDYAWRENGVNRSVAFAGLGTSFTPKGVVWESPPHSGGAWTSGKLDALELGASHNGTQAQDTYISWAAAMVDYDDGTTAVTLSSFTATGYDGEVLLEWQTASELNNLGFHLYRATSETGPYERITASVIPGLGSSPEGARYRYVDPGLTNGATLYYKLEDIETTGNTKQHGPVSATPEAGAETPAEDSPPSSSTPGSSPASITYGDPSAVSWRVLSSSPRQMLVELETGGFYAEPQSDGTVRLSVPDFIEESEPGSPALPVKRAWLEALAGLRLRVASVEAGEVVAFSGLRPSAADSLEVVATRSGTARVGRRRQGEGAAFRGAGLFPEEAARIVSVGFQGERKKALLELAPLRWERASGQLLLARRLTVRLVYSGPEPGERSLGGARGRQHRESPSHQTRPRLARLSVREKGLYRVSFEEVFGFRGQEFEASLLRLSRQGAPVAFHLEPNRSRFGPGGALYFLSEGAVLNPYGQDAVYELELRGSGSRMPVVSGAPSGAALGFYWQKLSREENRYYQAGLLEAPDRWLWDVLFAPVTKSYPLELRELASAATEPALLKLWLQGASDFAASPDHHVRVFVNGSLLAEESWDGKEPRQLRRELPTGLLREGENQLAIENVGDTGATYSMVMLDKFELSYPRLLMAEAGKLEGSFNESGEAGASGLSSAAHLLDVTEEPARWLSGAVSSNGTLRFRAEAGRNYLAVSAEAVLKPEVERPLPSHLKSRRNRSDYLVVGPQAFLEVAQPLLDWRRSEGLSVRAVALEEVYSEFGFGESRPEALQEFLAYAYHHWRAPSLRYVLLLGDATYDFKNYLGTGVLNQVPPLMVKTTYLWTASDPAYGAVNGDDILPDVAIGRLPAATVDEARVMVEKILAYERAGPGLAGPAVLVADNPDEAGDFEADAEEIASSLLASRNPRRIYLGQLGRDATHSAIVEAFDQGASVLSYIGHGAIHLWAQENIFQIGQVPSLGPQPRQPLVLTLNCLNGYFHFPYFNALGEELLKAEGKGALAAFSPSGLSLNEPAHLFHKALLGELLFQDHARLGDAVVAAQAVYAESGAFPELLSIYHLLGDPALKLR